ncbi:AraC-type DNA-binding protein [Catalinimonas alkaloidigena]|uniref:AraC-type DNA-binding protein n=1 Tax=Catalinimonas alkaloidigena TaxID=1075417 RepID=A0A1G9C2J8_9BACT|nr:AraC family transcriptional regulator [Catalinimonas alkaloidigena]SDK45505.1 AraC-type DNA-binding protein [Catalinimonas alkaloidigena]
MVSNADRITSCYLGPQISPEQFVAEHMFLFLLKGTLHGYDGHRHHTLRPGECCLVRKNQLARYTKQKDEGQFEKVVVIFDAPFLKSYQERHAVTAEPAHVSGPFVRLEPGELIPTFIRSLRPYYQMGGQIDDAFAHVKREELLLILLRTHPKLAALFFDFGPPHKVDLEAFMHRHYKFNVSIERFAFLTGRSLSAFKRDFRQIFSDTPSRWLVQRRLEEAYFLLDHEGGKPSDIYLDLGFEDLSHFSFAFKKKYGVAPTQLSKNVSVLRPSPMT